MAFYLTFCSWIFISSIAKPKTILNNKNISMFLSMLFFILATVLILNKDFYQGDMVNYVDELRNMQSYSLLGAFHHFTWEPMFLLLQWVVSRFTGSAAIWVLITWILYYIVLLTAVKKIAPNQYIFILFAYLNFSMFYDYFFVGTRQGFALVFMLLAVSYWFNNEKPMKIILASVTSVLFHYSALPIFLLLIVIRRPTWTLKKLIFIWLASLAMFLTRLHEKFVMLFSNYIPELNQYNSYESFRHFGSTGNRLDFLLFSVGILVVCLLLYRLIETNNPQLYELLIKCYIAFNCYFLLFGFISFSYRVSAYSWFLLPILLWFPFLNQKNHNPYLMFAATAITFVVGVFTNTIFF